MEGKWLPLINSFAEVDTSPTRDMVEQLTFLYKAARALSSSLNTAEVLHMLMRLTQQYFRPAAVSVALVKADGSLVFEAASGESARQILGMRLPKGRGIVGWVAERGEPLWVPCVRSDERHYRGADEETGFQTKSIYAMPVRVKDQTLAVLELINPDPDKRWDESPKVLSALASLAAPAIRNANLFEQVQQAEQRYQRLFELNLDPIVILNVAGEMLHCNRAAQRLFEPLALCAGQTCLDVLGLSKARFDNIRQSLSEGHVSTWELDVMTSQTESRIFEINMIYLPDYTVEGAYQWLAHDITDRVELDRLRKEWANMLVHDLRAPLNIVLNSVELVQTAWREKDATMPLNRILEITERNVKRLEHLIDNILDMDKIEAGEKLLRITGINIPDMVREVLEIIEPASSSRGQILRTEVPEDLPFMQGDLDVMRRVLINLLENAVKFTSKGGTVSLTVQATDREFLFNVTDTGRGISPQDAEHVFELFYRGKDKYRHNQKIKGSGIGLAFCKLAVEAHGGKIWVESDLGAGSSFTFSIPRREV